MVIATETARPVPGQIRGDFPMLSHWTHFNCGGMAPLSHEVGAELLRVPTEVLEQGTVRLLSYDREFLRQEAARDTLARFIGATADEVTFTTQFSTGVNIVCEGLKWNEGDEIIVTDQEHPALLTPLVNLKQRFGVEIKRIPVSNDLDQILTSYKALLTDRTRMVAVSHVTTDSGTILPVEEMTKLAHEKGAYMLLDGAHSVGQFPVDVKAIGCDFYAIVGYKWLLGPYPSAALYIREDLIDRLQVTWTGSRATKSASVTMDVDELHWIDGAKRWEYGGRTFSYDTSMVKGLEYIDRIGIDVVQQHARALTERLHDGIRAIPGAKLNSPVTLGETTGIANVALKNVDGLTFSNTLRDRWKMIVRPALWGTSIRISLACFINEQDLDNLLENISTLAKG